MQPFQNTDVSTQEWRWVGLWGGLLVTLTLLPYAWAILVSDNTWHFMGILADPLDGASYFAKIQQGIEGNWLFETRYTPEQHDTAGLFTFYLLLGHIARLLGFSTIVIYHLVRIATSLFMFMSLYWLGAHIWRRTRPRQLFFILSSVASGLGWLAVILFGPEFGTGSPDLSTPEAIPLYAAYTNPHFPLSIAGIALVAGILLEAFRPGFTDAPDVENGGIMLIMISVIVAIIQPPAMVSIGGALVLFIIVTAYNNYLQQGVPLRQVRWIDILPWHEIRWGAMVWLPAFPVALYYLLVFNTNSVMAEFNRQNDTMSPNIILTLAGYSPLLIIAAPGIIRAVRHVERDGDQFMLLWLIVNGIVLYTPYDLQRRFFIGLIIPITFFAVRSLEDHWLNTISKRWHQMALIMAFILMLPSHAIALGIPLIGAVADREAGADVGIVLEKDYVETYDWLDKVGREDEVVLASEYVSLWVPARTSLRVVYGHPAETVPAEERQGQVEDFFSGRNCQTLVFSDELPFQVDYVIWGPAERELAEEIRADKPDRNYEDCIDQLAQQLDSEQIKTFDSVTLFTVRELR
ncbi:MAG: NnrS family protein [Chloroflexi bacterium]|nr:NnrS family protein [Chloroflexota bacterium]